MDSFSIWAKSKKVNCQSSNKERIITLAEHTKNLLEKFDEIKHHLKSDLHLPVILAIQLHDIGKALPKFQYKLGNNTYQPYDLTIDIDHSIFSILLINKEKLVEELKNIDLNDNYSNLVLSAVAFHHWRDKFNDLIMFGSDHFKELSLKLKSLQNQLIFNLENQLSQIEGFNKSLIKFDEEIINGLADDVPVTDYITPLYQLYYLPKRINISEDIKKDWILIAGYLLRCDHFASYCEEENLTETIEILPLEFIDIEQNIRKVISSKLTNANGQQIWQLEKVNELRGKNGILIAPTGVGKTEFAFLWAGDNKLFYTLPLRAAVEQIYERAKNIYKTTDEKVGLLHFDADVYLIGDDKEESAIRRYDNARQLAFPVTISTADQFFPYALRPPGYEKIYSVFSYSKLIVDEIQAYDPIAAAVVVKFIEDVAIMGGQTLIMTATLPQFIKDEIEERLKKLNSSIHLLNLYETEKQKLENLKKHNIKLRSIENKNKDKESKFNLDDSILDDIIKIGKNNRVLVILNTIQLAQKIYDQLKDKCAEQKIEIYLLHSRFTFNDRKKIQEEIAQVFKNPKPQNENQGKILIATQVIEAAIDIDADFLFTEIAPLDALIQRMGRVLRRYNSNFIYNDNLPNVNILLFEDGNESGNGRVYFEELIKLTYIILKNIIENKSVDQNAISEELSKYYDTLTSRKSKRQKKEELVIPSDSILVSEYQKYELINLLFNTLSGKDGKYLQRFKNTLDLLDSGYMSEKKSEAQKKFRPIVSTSVISLSKKSELEKSILNFVKNYESYNRPYTMFKEKIISEFVVNVNGLKNPGKQDSLAYFIYKFNIDEQYKNTISRWMEDIYFIEIDYDSKKGLDKKIDKSLINYSNIL